METNRIEAFSDGVLAIAITLLVLDLAVPARSGLEGRSLAHALAQEWPSYAAYLVSFMVIGIIWVNHHAVFALLRAVDRWVLFANLLLLMFVSVIPFPTRLLAEYLTSGSDARTAAAVYGGTMLLMAMAYSLLYVAVTHDDKLLAPGVDPVAARARRPRFAAGILVYLATFLLAFVSAYATLAASFAIAVYYCFDQLGGRARTTPVSD